MVLHTLEFSDCFLDSPFFRKSIQEYEDELERTNSQIKQLIKDAKNMLNASRQQGKMMNAFNDRLQNFQFDCIGENLTDTEKGIAGSLKEFGLMLEEVANDWSSTIERSELQLIKPLEDFRKEHIHSYRSSKKAFDKASERYYKQLEQTLALSHKKKCQQLQESDNELFTHKKTFHKEALNYVYKLQEVQERKKFEFVEHLLMFMQVYFNFFHQSHETANDCKDYMKELQIRLVSTRAQYEGTREKTKTLMRKMSDHPDTAEESAGSGVQWTKAGYLFLNEKNPISSRFTSKWTKYFCMYTKEAKLFQMLTPYHHPTSAIPSLNQAPAVGFAEPVIVKTCTRRITDSIDKRFCFDLEVEDQSGKQSLLTFQAVSDVDRKKWMSVMDGREPEYIKTRHDLKKKEGQFKLDETGFKFVEQVIAEIERRGVEHEGIYRLVGVLSKVDLLLQQAVSPATCDSVEYSNDSEWEINTLTSALKSCFRNLPEPIMTFELHRDFINAAKLNNPDDRVTKVKELIHQLPKTNQRVLSLLAPHLRKVQSHHLINKMTIQNLGVCFGPTLMREREETVQSIMEIKFSNIIVEIIIEFMFLEEDEEVFSDTDAEKSSTPHTPNPRISRLPSQRLRQRPRPIYEYASVPGILEEDGASTESDGSSRFKRSRAFRSQNRTPSPNITTKYRNERDKMDHTPDHSFSSSDEEDDFGERSPLDMKLNIEDMTPSSEKTFASGLKEEVKDDPGGSDGEIKPTSGKSKDDPTVKETWNPKGGLKPKERPKITPRSPRLREAMTHSEPKESNSTPSNPDSENSVTRRETGKKTGAAKQRVTSLLRRKPVSADDQAVYAKVDKTRNHNSNNNNVSKTVSIAQRKMKLMATAVTAGLPHKTTRKDATEAKRPTRLSDSSERKVLKSPAMNTRPKSALIPAAFLVEENNPCLLTATPKQSKSPLATPVPLRATEKHTSEDITSNATGTQPPSFLWGPTDGPRSRPRSFAMVTSPDRLSPTGSDVTTPSLARTLFACEAERDGELSFQPGMLIKQLQPTDEPGWLRGVLNGEEGLVPENYVEFI
ncbi:rho GTPase-activating protein 26 [Ciona intestinalis]